MRTRIFVVVFVCKPLSIIGLIYLPKIIFYKEWISVKMDTTKKLCALAMMSALAFVLAAFVRIPMVSMPPLILRYDPKDVIIVIAGFIYGPMSAILVAAVVSFIQMITVSATGFFGLFMNISASVAFCCPAALIYKKNRTVKGAILGLAIGVVFATAIMLMLNSFIVPLFTNRPREQVLPFLIPAFLPFNLISNTLNAALAMLFYKHIKAILQSTGLMPITEDTGKKGEFSKSIFIASLFVILTCVVWVLILQGIL